MLRSVGRGSASFIVGNWKMNGRRADLATLDAILAQAPRAETVVALCPPAQLLAAFAARAEEGGGHVAIGAQDCSAESDGAFTGELSADMLADAGAACVIVGHSERRARHGETDAVVAAKAAAALRAGLTPIICVGETKAERDAGRAADVVAAQARASAPAEADGASVLLAYEPVWAIGTGAVATLADIEEIHRVARAAFAEGRGGPQAAVLYGGSVKPGNAQEILASGEVDGVLVGGASLKADDFGAIVAGAPAA
ncbi:MAG: triose-phosphate isomerase [Pseudomonadota bacterium]